MVRSHPGPFLKPMPELPEVETIRNQLKTKIKAKRIKKVEVKLPKIIRDTSVIFLKKKITGSRIKDINRRAKLLIIHLSNNYSLIIHLKLSGQLVYYSDLKHKKEKYTHLIYYFSDNSCLCHNDLRQFGYVKLIKTADLEKLFQKQGFGPEPLSKDFTLKKFKELLNKRPNSKIKPLLMDQSFIAGIGNIYAQEACWRAQILPTRLVKSLSEKEIKDLYQSLIKILKTAIKDKGTTALDDYYIDAQGKRGKYVMKLKVYQRENKKCFRCGQKIKRINLGGRGTSYCPVCQK